MITIQNIKQKIIIVKVTAETSERIEYPKAALKIWKISEGVIVVK